MSFFLFASDRNITVSGASYIDMCILNMQVKHIPISYAYTVWS